MENNAEKAVTSLMEIWASLSNEQWQDVIRLALTKLDHWEYFTLDEHVTILYFLAENE